MSKPTKTRSAAKNGKGEAFIPRTELGRAAIELRRKALRSGRATKTVDQILREIKQLRSGAAG